MQQHDMSIGATVGAATVAGETINAIVELQQTARFAADASANNRSSSGVPQRSYTQQNMSFSIRLHPAHESPSAAQMMRPRQSIEQVQRMRPGRLHH